MWQRCCLTKPNEEGLRPLIFFHNRNVVGGRGGGGGEGFSTPTVIISLSLYQSSFVWGKLVTGGRVARLLVACVAGGWK